MIREISTCRFIDNAENVLLVGPPGVGKTHLAVAFGLKAIEAGYSTLFLTAAGLIAQLEKAERENRLDEELKRLCGPKLLIIDGPEFCRSRRSEPSARALTTGGGHFSARTRGHFSTRIDVVDRRGRGAPPKCRNAALSPPASAPAARS